MARPPAPQNQKKTNIKHKTNMKSTAYPPSATRSQPHYSIPDYGWPGYSATSPHAEAHTHAAHSRLGNSSSSKYIYVGGLFAVKLCVVCVLSRVRGLLMVGGVGRE